ncbi:MAG: SUMF1/EgtB/PvdO family nonheme iron enzyme [Bacteroidia bacterium]
MGGIENAIYPWGNEGLSYNDHKANLWQGSFPYYNSNLDGHEITAPIKSFKANGYGLFDMAGNVWEYCQDAYSESSYERHWKESTVENPLMENATEKDHVIRGGSFLCNASYCAGYRTSRRMYSTASHDHVRFRCVRDN